MKKVNDKLIFSKIKNKDIFCEEFLEFKKNNVIEFSEEKIAVLYGPNGIGKSSFAKVLNYEEDTEFEVEIICKGVENKKDVFHIISDQNHRNVIQGKESDYLMGENIRRELELKGLIIDERDSIFESLTHKLKSEYNISKASSKLLTKVKNDRIKNFIKDIANVRNKGKDWKIKDFIELIKVLSSEDVEDFEDEKMNFLKKDFEDKDSIIKKILGLDSAEIKQNKDVFKIEEHGDAIKILNKFDYIDDCIVCDTKKIRRAKLVISKTKYKEQMFRELDEKTKKILEQIIIFMDNQQNDSFEIKTILLKSIKTGNRALVDNLKSEIEDYFIILNKQLNNAFFNCLVNSNLKKDNQEYEQLRDKIPELDSDDILLIRDIINANIGKEIIINRDENYNLTLKLGRNNLLNTKRDDLFLSTGEQNFISLAFELLKAKKSNKKIIVLDDPISSFDSIYKNKIVYCIVDILKDKHQIILTHNTELIKLLEHQHSNCSNLYLFNNEDGADNGFIRVNREEQNILLYLDKLLGLFRCRIICEIENKKMFLISMIPFMRGYAQILDEKEIKNKLTKLMHGYNNDSVDIADIYKKLFGIEIMSEYEISAKAICELEDMERQILKPYTEFKLLENTLYHNLVYLYLRLNVEKVLVEKFKINTKKYNLLGNIIDKAFGKNNDKMEEKDKSENRTKFLSKKTLLNEFNHFEGNMNIFQPAIDISDSALKNEKNEIIELLENIKNQPTAI